jgi:hypothetical protein
MIGKDSVRLNPDAGIPALRKNASRSVVRLVRVANGGEIGFSGGTFAGRALFGTATSLNRGRVIGWVRTNQAFGMSDGLRIYNLFPSLAGTIRDWMGHLPRIAGMGFNAVYVNPFHYPGFSGSLYAVKDYYRLNPRFHGTEPGDDDALLRASTGCA